MADDKAAKERAALVKAALKEGGKKGVDLEGMNALGGVKFFNIAVDVPNGDFELLEKVMEGANAEVDEAAEERKGGAGQIGKMFASAGDTQLAMMIHVPASLVDAETKAPLLTVREWAQAMVDAVAAEVVEESAEFAKLKVPASEGVFPLKKREEAVAAGIALFRAKKLIPDADDSDDDVNYAEAAGVEW